MLLNIVIFLALLAIINISSIASFKLSASPIHYSGSWTRCKPLSTAEVFGTIPRLEPGLRLPVVVDFDTKRQTTLSTFKLSWLSSPETGPYSSYTPSSDNFCFFGMLNSLATTTQRMNKSMSQFLLKHTSKLLAAILIVSSHQRLSRFSTVAATVITTGLTQSMFVDAGILSNVASVFKKPLQPTRAFRQVASTPLFYLATARGQQYLQEDVQVQCKTCLCAVCSPSPLLLYRLGDRSRRSWCTSCHPATPLRTRRKWRRPAAPQTCALLWCPWTR